MPGCARYFFEGKKVHEFLIALALVLVIEGILPFLSPKSMRSYMSQMSEMNDRTLRVTGLVMMVIGVIMLYIVK